MCSREDVTFHCDLKIGWLWFQYVGHGTMMLGTIQPNRPIDMQTMYLDFFAAGQLKQRRIRTGRGPPQKHCQNQTHFFWVWTYCQQYGVLVASWACVCDKLVLFASNRTLGLQVWTQRNLGWHVFFFWKGKIACINCSATSCKSSALVDQVNSRGATSTYNGTSNSYSFNLHIGLENESVH